ncbi:hypothetical protein Tco_0277605 [Tanacetum coccineum]
MTSVMSAWPFSQWGIDIVGPLPIAPGGASARKAGYQGKMRPTWEGPYVTRKAYGDGAYKLETLSGEAVDRTWNGTNLRKFYV